MPIRYPVCIFDSLCTFAFVCIYPCISASFCLFLRLSASVCICLLLCLHLCLHLCLSVWISFSLHLYHCLSLPFSLRLCDPASLSTSLPLSTSRPSFLWSRREHLYSLLYANLQCATTCIRIIGSWISVLNALRCVGPQIYMFDVSLNFFFKFKFCDINTTTLLQIHQPLRMRDAKWIINLIGFIAGFNLLQSLILLRWGSDL
jgi:hypothetical protein